MAGWQGAGVGAGLGAYLVIAGIMAKLSVPECVHYAALLEVLFCGGTTSR